MGHNFSTDESYQTGHTGSPVIDAKDKRIAELESALRNLRSVAQHVVACWENARHATDNERDAAFAALRAELDSN